MTQSNDRMSVLEINPVTIDSNGNYSCVVQNRFGRDEYTAAVSVKGEYLSVYVVSPPGTVSSIV